MNSPDPLTSHSAPEQTLRSITATLLLSALAASAASAILLWVARPYLPVWPNLALAYGLYQLATALLLGIPLLLLLRKLSVGPLWMAVPAAALMAAGPIAALVLLSSPNPTWPESWPIALDAISGAVGGLAYWRLKAQDADLRRRLRTALWSVLALLAAGTAGWHLVWRVDERRRMPWEEAASAECPLMALSMSRVAAAEHLPHLPPLYAQSRSGGPCHWRRMGLNLVQGVRDDLYLTSDDSGRVTGHFTPHLVLNRPMYAWARLRATVPVVYTSGPLGADSYACHFHRSLSGWTFEGCSLDRMI